MKDKTKEIANVVEESNKKVTDIIQDLNKNYFEFTRENIERSIISLSKTNLFATESSLL
jgi:hypothetical protein